jgi:hypothetical protein
MQMCILLVQLIRKKSKLALLLDKKGGVVGERSSLLLDKKGGELRSLLN